MRINLQFYCKPISGQDTGNSLPASNEIKSALSDKLSAMKSEGEDFDVITFAGNGEPTLHPEFQRIIDFNIETQVSE